MLQITDHIFIDDEELTEKFIRASGPGGQNVNKVSSAVQLRFDLGANKSLHAGIKARAARLAGSRLTKDDVIVIHADGYRTQKANRQEARRRLAEILRAALRPPVKRKKTKPSKAALERRLQVKKQRAQIKTSRRTTAKDLE